MAIIQYPASSNQHQATISLHDERSRSIGRSIEVAAQIAIDVHREIQLHPTVDLDYILVEKYLTTS